MHPNHGFTSTFDRDDRLITEKYDATGTANGTFTLYSYSPSGNNWTMQTDQVPHCGYVTTLSRNQQYEIGLRLWQSAMYGMLGQNAQQIVEQFLP
jgi:hypothetical protein